MRLAFEHSFRPGDQQHLKALNGGSVSAVSNRDEQLCQIIGRMTAKTLKRDKARLLKILKGQA